MAVKRIKLSYVVRQVQFHTSYYDLDADEIEFSSLSGTVKCSIRILTRMPTRVYPKVSGLAAWSENCKWYSSLPLGAVVSLICESV
jgi:hypothetical protein